MLAALRAAAGNTAKAAVLLGISRPRVSQLVAEYKLANFRKRLIAERLMSEAAEPESPTVGAPVPQ